MRICTNKKYLFFLIFISGSCFSAPVNMYNDPVVFHNINGINPFPPQAKKRMHSIDFAPFYQSSNNAKNIHGEKVPAGDRIGRWNMLGLLQGQAAASGNLNSVQPAGFLGDLTPTLSTAILELNRVPGQGNNYLDENFSDSTHTFGYYSVPLDYEKVGVRGNITFNLMDNLSFSIKGGFAYYKQSPIFNDLTNISTNYSFSDLDIALTQTFLDIALTQTLLMLDGKRQAIANEIGLNLDSYSATGFEDIYLSILWNERFGMDDDEGNHVVTVVPYLEAGVWIPTGEKKDQNIAFSLPMGNDGFWAFTAAGGLNFDFIDSLYVGFGGNISIFNDQIQRNYRVPSSNKQSAIYPWKTTIKKRPGISWNLHAGAKAENFVEFLSLYVNYIYSRHEKDNISVLNYASLFKPDKLEYESVWSSQNVHAGFEYKVTKNLCFGVAIQFPITGKQVYKTVTLQGDLRFNF